MTMRMSSSIQGGYSQAGTSSPPYRYAQLQPLATNHAVFRGMGPKGPLGCIQLVPELTVENQVSHTSFGSTPGSRPAKLRRDSSAKTYCKCEDSAAGPHSPSSLRPVLLRGSSQEPPSPILAGSTPTFAGGPPAARRLIARAVAKRPSCGGGMLPRTKPALVGGSRAGGDTTTPFAGGSQRLCRRRLRPSWPPLAPSTDGSAAATEPLPSCGAPLRVLKQSWPGLLDFMNSSWCCMCICCAIIAHAHCCCIIICCCRHMSRASNTFEAPFFFVLISGLPFFSFFAFLSFVFLFAPFWSDEELADEKLLEEELSSEGAVVLFFFAPAARGPVERGLRDLPDRPLAGEELLSSSSELPALTAAAAAAAALRRSAVSARSLFAAFASSSEASLSVAAAEPEAGAPFPAAWD
mmetsp:Transcript_24927/g.70998  ORF Transcript_24927/g.70998 Transcript_24927/m.70998 type:complete len:408 (-) Transcript_24927:353-1576(-)